MTEQLILELAGPAPATFDNFVAGRNAELVAALRAVAAGGAGDTGFLLWGAPGAGKSHLLRAVVAAVRARGAQAALFDTPGALAAADPDLLGRHALVAVDNVETAGADAQARLFTLFNVLRAAGGRLVVASAVSPAALPLRADLRSRLGWGAVQEVLPLDDAGKPAALIAWARQRGFGLSDEVIAYLLAHGRRDMTTLLATLEALDRKSLAAKRPITLPLLRAWLQGETRL
ncbi:MAG: DnaA regulatory inactivator Hda [Betaproteobacteria bacterium]|jgi:DnaA family protein|nr:DnaA regulatory inactivator Hda [Betaproteobacteria bacterium]MBK7744181.1 DnaA regulatory inactivator Hda [Betaproteobacteria bacterium]MBK8690033.1 DnaA regulatory inactivator Hda [Betaproteobacteria bacterium]MBK9702783.1 DnaA regulatory inactivator Hda [Betaproteobacteria bacterium]MBL0291438.1 DnaA regulatory inactivator Hda [Betaproteobacteria bacterium]